MPFSDSTGLRAVPARPDQTPTTARARAHALACFLVLLAGAPSSAVAADPKAIADSGSSAGAPACSACHGQSGEGLPDAGYPRLAGLDAGYLRQQLDDFASGARASDVMQPVATALHPDERQAMASYYASLSAPKAADEKSPDPKAIDAGSALAKRGLWSKGVPACARCHGPKGEGVGAAFPGLAGQSAEYIAAQLGAWKSGRRKNDPLHLMSGIASKLDEPQIAAVAAYYASLNAAPVAAPGKGRKP